MRFAPLIYATVTLLVFFGAVGVMLFFRALSAARAEHRVPGPPTRRTLAERITAYVGPVDRSRAVLTPLLRVLVEFFFALGGFPGLGWLLSGRMVPGLLLMTIGPSLVWGLMPVFLSTTGLLLRSAFSVVVYLPVVAAVSAGSLMFAELRHPAAETDAA